jgi:hypothetical protein
MHLQKECVGSLLFQGLRATSFQDVAAGGTPPACPEDWLAIGDTSPTTVGNLATAYASQAPRLVSALRAQRAVEEFKIKVQSEQSALDCGIK